MTPSFKVDTRQFAATIRRVIEQSSRAAPDVVNQMAYDVAVGAAMGTKIADKNEIARTLGQVGNKLNFTKRGVLRRGRGMRGAAILREDSFAARIVNARRREAGGVENMIWGNPLEEAARKLIRSRQNSVGFIASGFVRAARILRQYARFKLRETPKGIRVIPDGPGGRARPSMAGGGFFGSGRFTATVENDVVTSGGRFQAKGKTFNPGPIAERGFKAGIDFAEKKVFAHMQKKLMEAMKKARAI